MPKVSRIYKNYLGAKSLAFRLIFRRGSIDLVAFGFTVFTGKYALQVFSHDGPASIHHG